MAIFIGVGLVYKEIEKRTLYSLLSKPIRRWEFLVGKYAGLLLTLAVNTAFMTLGLAAALFYVGRHFERSDASILGAIYFIVLEFALLTALALFFFPAFKPAAFNPVYAGNLYCRCIFERTSHHRRLHPESRPCWPSRAPCIIWSRTFTISTQFRRGRTEA